ncbi:hypothetical protein WJX84_005158 [Apatococcus fuscideae]|uniref:Thiamine pyrimidine synthase n=1 Tax=Apatococcus fuscideae TaxID=2026836 RepID=A0AAW1RXV3_9CHLO
MPGELALDWTPNTNHTGFYVAQSKGWYADEHIKLEISSPHTSDYQITPVNLLTQDKVTFAIAPSESIISAQTLQNATDKPHIQAVAAVLQQDTSAIVTRTDSGIDRPAQLDGKRYASYGARYEGRIVQQLIRNDGGKGEFEEFTPPKLGIWDTILKGEADATWIFEGWEGIEAEQKSVALNRFRLADYGVPYGYSPLVLACSDTLQKSPDLVRGFLKATARGFQYAADHPDEAAKIFFDQASKELQGDAPSAELHWEQVQASQPFVSKHYLSKDGSWGAMDTARWDKFLDWLSEAGLLTTKVQSRHAESSTTSSLMGLLKGDVGDRIPRTSVKASELFTNSYLSS